MLLRQFLIVQWQGSAMTLDELARLEDLLEQRVAEEGLRAEFSGHDVGTNEVNIFIRCDEPDRVFGVVRSSLEPGQCVGLRAAQRLCDGEDYTAVWPLGMVDFKVT